MSIKNNTLQCKNGSVSLQEIKYAEIHISKNNDIIVKGDILLRRSGVFVSYRDEIDIADIEILEDYFIDSGINYFTIVHKN